VKGNAVLPIKPVGKSIERNKACSYNGPQTESMKLSYTIQYTYGEIATSSGPRFVIDTLGTQIALAFCAAFR
jgi:hypothetical protein